MDVFSHALWTNVAYLSKYKDRSRDRLWAVFLGVAPDLVSFAPVVIYALFTRTKFPQPPVFLDHPLFRYAIESYNYTHSLVVFLFVFAIVAVLRRGKVYWPLLAWAFHIVLDIFTHPNFFSTPFLYPLWEYKVRFGLSWAEPHFLAINWIVLLCLYTYIFISARKRKSA